MTIESLYTGPMYIFDIDKLKDRIKFLKTKLFTGDLCYAIKANTFIISSIKNDVERFEVCSPGELEICYQQDIPLEKVVVSGVYKSYESIEEAIANHPSIGFYTIESMEQLNLLHRLSTKYNRMLNVLIRLSSGNQFGLDYSHIFNIINNRNEYKLLNIKGLEYYSGTQKTSLKRIEKELLKIDSFITQIESELGFVIEELEYGPGYPVSYFQDDKFFDDEQYAEELNNLLKSLNFKRKITIEIGRGVAACCGTYYTKVMDTKTTENQNYAIVDGGMNHLVYFGQMMAMKRPFFDIIPNRNDNLKIWNVCGALCSVNDIIMKQVEMDLKVNDILCFKNTGAYSMTEGISLFLSRELPKIYLLQNKEYVLVRDSYKTSILNSFYKEV